uniref:Uncharacterized protein n=1 Tax=Oryza glaberrima TaxID=4538 RepID=I1PU28_ORYGL
WTPPPPPVWRMFFSLSKPLIRRRRRFPVTVGFVTEDTEGPSARQPPAGTKRARPAQPTKDDGAKNIRRKKQADASQMDAELVESHVNKQTIYARCSPKFVFDACAALSPSHRQALSGLRLGQLADMTLDGFEQPDLIRWLMDRTDPKTMTIQISENKKIAITPWKISIVLGTPFGGEPLQYPDKKCMAAAFAQLANELGVPPSSNISVPMLKRLTIDRLHTPRIQLYTKDLVEAISQGDRVKDEEDKIVFGQLNVRIYAISFFYPFSRTVTQTTIRTKSHVVTMLAPLLRMS